MVEVVRVLPQIAGRVRLGDQPFSHKRLFRLSDWISKEERRIPVNRSSPASDPLSIRTKKHVTPFIPNISQLIPHYPTNFPHPDGIAHGARGAKLSSIRMIK
jgi:hypothetical protein